MAQDDSGDKTEEPTHKKLEDARKKGDVPKSKEITSTLTLLTWTGLAILAVPYSAQRLGALILHAIDGMNQPFSFAAPAMGWLAFEAVLWVTASLLIPVVGIALLVEFLQAGPVFTFEKFKPKLENMDPVAGVKRMFSPDQLMEVIKSAVKTAVLLFIGWVVLKSLLPQIALLPTGRPGLIGTAMWTFTFKLLAWSVGVFFIVSALDLLWTHHRFTKKMRMSRRDIMQEHKESEGDPHTKGHRKQLHREWSQRNATNSAAKANVVVVNPTHVAIAIDYDKETSPVPTIAAKGEDDLALAMREAAQKAGVPVVRNIALARDMLARAEEGEIIPQDLFEIMAEVILWARDVREQVDAYNDVLGPSAPLSDETDAPAAKRAVRKAPGEDLTRYPEGYTPPY